MRPRTRSVPFGVRGWTVALYSGDGRLLGCCFNFWGDFGGNAFKQGLEHARGSEKLVYARRMLRGEFPRTPASRAQRVACTSNGVSRVVGSAGES